MKKVLALAILYSVAAYCYAQEVEWFIDKHGRWGIKDKSGKIIMAPKYYGVKKFVNGFAGVRTDVKWGFVNEKGQEVIAPQYDDVEDMIPQNPIQSRGQVDCANVKRGGKTGKVDVKNNLLVPIIYDEVGVFSDGKVAVRNNKGWGYIDSEGQIVIAPRFSEAFPFVNGWAFVQGWNDKYYIIDEEGTVYFSTEGFDVVRKLGNSHFIAATDVETDSEGIIYGGKWGILKLDKEVYWSLKKIYDQISFDGSTVFLKRNGKWGELNKVYYSVWYEPQWDWIGSYKDGLAPVRMGNKYGCIKGNDKKIIVPVNYDSVFNISDGYLGVKLKGLIGLFNENGQQVLPFKYEWIHKVKSGGFVVKSNNKLGLFDEKGKQLTPFKYDAVVPGENYPLLAFQFNKKWGVLNHSGKELTPFVYDSYKMLESGFVVVQKEGKWGVINTTGIEVLSCRYDNIEWSSYAAIISPNDLLLRVSESYMYGYINTAGKIIVPSTYSFATDFDGFIGRVRNKDDKWGAVDSQGKLVIPCQYDKIDDFNEGLAGVQINNKWGYINRDGTIVLPAIYESASGFTNGKAWVKQNGRSFLITRNGAEVSVD